ncbi:MAG: LytTR family transcriptional regulator [Bacteroidia bacterium]|nr:LytTR family transcriptional regulator [Bacteroidia bacterium]
MILRVFTAFFLIFSSIGSSYSQDVNQEYKRLEDLTRKHLRTPDSLLLYSQKMLEFSQKHNLTNGKKEAYRFLGIANSRLQNYQKSNLFFYKALRFSKELGDTRFEHIIYNDLSINHRNTKYYDSAIYYSKKLINIYRTSDDKRSLNMSYMNLGISYFSKLSLDSAQYYLDQSIKGFKKNENLMLVTNNLSLLAEVYFQKEDYNKALKIADSSQKLAEKLKLQRNYSRNYNLLARIHNKLNNKEAYNKYIKLEEANRLKNIDPRNIKVGGINESQQKSITQHYLDKEKHLSEDKLFYKNNLFKIVALAIFLFFISIYFYKKNNKSQNEISLLREKLKSHAENNIVESELLYLKSKAVINSNKLRFIKSAGHYLEFHIAGKEKPEIDRNSLISILETLPSQQFVRIHKSYIVNIAYIKIINSTKLMLNDGTWINLSRTYKQQLKEVLNIK